MAEKKKTTSTAKKKTTTKKSVAKKASTKKVVAKKTTAKKAVTKKTTPKKKPTKKTPVKAMTPKVANTPKASVLNFTAWKSLAGKTLKLFPAMWWRIGLINVVSFILIMVLFALAAGSVIPLAGGSLAAVESEFANLRLGNPNLMFLWGLGLVAIVALTILFVISFLTSTALLLTVKKFKNKKPNNPMGSLFKDSWHFLGRYAWISVRAMWYIFWPFALLFVPATVLSLLAATGSYGDMSMIMLPVMVALFIASFVVVIARAVNVVSAYTVLIESDKTASNSFHKALSLIKGNWWPVVVAFILFMVPIILIQQLLAIDYTATPDFVVPGTPMKLDMTGETSILGFLFSFFVVSPLTVSFTYLLTLHLSKVKKN